MKANSLHLVGAALLASALFGSTPPLQAGSLLDSQVWNGMNGPYAMESSDDTVYTASEADVRAFAPDGTLKWVFVQNPPSFICQDMAVGPDGNVYVGTTEGMGTFSLTPQGQLRWQLPEPYHQPPIDKSQIVFGLNTAPTKCTFLGDFGFSSTDVGLDGTHYVTASFNTSGGRGTYTLTVNNLTKTGYTFDQASSILTKSITK